MRIYLPTTLPALAAARAAGRATDGPARAFGVTPRLREWYAEGDLEELEYAAMTAAARASLAQLAADRSAPPRRVVLAADVPDGWLRPADGGHRAELRVAEPVPWSVLASVHVDDPAAAGTVAAAVPLVAAAEAGDEDAQFVLDGLEDEALLWYAVQEVDQLLASGADVQGESSG